ncbi:MAG: prephenate dehydratase [Bacteroidota bacterium]|nr:prephenate dehydratase [Bacteroidota bacterium]
MHRVSIQGYQGSFHQIAAINFLGNDVKVIPCATFREVVKVASNTKLSDGGFMAIENSIAGSILPNYALLQKSNLKISGEIYLHINQNLMVNKGVQLKDIKEVHSHPMALQQCLNYLEKNPEWKLIETEDTALSAKYIHQHRHKHAAAIASALAAELYDLDIIAPKIQTHKNNYTRFLFLQKQSSIKYKGEMNKASISFYTDHSKGILAKVLTKIAASNINLSKLQSMPIPHTEWQYSFHADIEFENIYQFEKAIENIRSNVYDLKIFGIYKKGKTFF